MNKLETYKVSKLDLEQMSESEISFLASELLVTFSEEKKEDKRTFWDKVTNINQEFVYKFYRYQDESYLSTNNPNISKSRLNLSGSTPDFHLRSLKSLSSDVVIGSDYFKAEGRYFRLISLLEMPSELSCSELDSYGDYCVFFKPINREKSHRKLKVSRNVHFSSLVGAGPKDLEGELSHHESEEMLSDLIQGIQSMFRVEVFFIVSADSEKELNLKTLELLKDLKVSGARPFVETNSLYQLIESIFSENEPKFLRAADKNSAYLFNLLPLQDDYLMDEGISLRSLNGKEVNFDLFDQSSINFNGLVTGESGSGKSMFVQKLVKEEFEKGRSILVLDLGNSFKKLANYFEAREFSKSFNPMAFSNPHYLKEFCLSFLDKGELTKKDEGVVFKVISEVISKGEKINFKELIAEIDRELKGFSLYFEEYLSYFNDEVYTKSKEAEFVYVDTTIYPDKVKKGLIIYLFEYFKNFNDSEKLLVIDEAWSLLKDNAAYIEECFRTFRKFKASAIAISQSLGDFYKDSLGRAIFNNSFYKFIFRQSTTDLSVFDEYDTEKIESINSVKGMYSQFYFKSSLHRKVLNYISTPSEYELFTSSRDDNKKLERFFRVNTPYYGFKETFNRWVNFKYLGNGGVL